ncbi:hypothetical protein BDA96_04G161400 [Sorghum bicolor]|uniref:Uncharacterized protein n=1 Tax=Sorghum bicolor TaxID=4558 RepID=A0A921R5E0_SORBI|nr:hypothetical protein BDA96_04G161400 [Sorghum bicolor]
MGSRFPTEPVTCAGQSPVVVHEKGKVKKLKVVKTRRNYELVMCDLLAHIAS